MKIGYTGGHRSDTTPDIAVDPSTGTCHITWSDQPYDELIPPGENWSEKRRIMYTRRYSNGFWDPSPTQISGYWGTQPGISSQCRKPDIEIDSDGNPHIFWSQRHIESHQHYYLDIYYRTSTNGGSTWLFANEQGTGRHGYNVTQVDPAEWGKFLPQRPRFKIDGQNNLHLVYTCIYRFSLQDADIRTAFYLENDGAWPLDPMGCEVAAAYTNKEEADIAIRDISNSSYPYISYTLKNGSVSDHGKAIVRLNYLNTSNNWVDRLVFQDGGSTVVLSHFPCISIEDSEICIAVKHTLGIIGGQLSQYIKFRRDTQGSGLNWSTISVDDTAGAGYVSMVRHDSGDVLMVYSDTIIVGGLFKPDLYFFRY